MQQVGIQNLWIGNAGDLQNLRAIYDGEIEAILDLGANENASQLGRELVYCRIPIIDGGENSPSMLLLAIKTLIELLRSEKPTLVLCSAGLSRSPCVVAAALSILNHIPPEKCLEGLSEKRKLDVSPTLWNDIKKLVKDLEL